MDKIRNISISYIQKLIIYIFIFLICIFISLICLANIFYIKSPINTKVNTNSSIDYKVYLKENNFYEEEYISKNNSTTDIFLAKIIDKIDIDFNYQIKTTKKIDIEYEYSIKAILTISPVDNTNKTYYSKTYTLLENATKEQKNQTNNIHELISIDYDYYRQLANQFKSTLGVETSNLLTIYMSINKKSNDSLLNGDKNDSLIVKIPLTNKDVDIKLEYQDINKTGTLVEHFNGINMNVLIMIISIIFLLIALHYSIKIIRHININNTKNLKYEKYIKRIKKDYSRLIIETSNRPNTEGKEIIRLNSFEDLLDVRDSIKLPINKYTTAKNQKNIFYFYDKNKVYMYSIKESDIKKNTRII